MTHDYQGNGTTTLFAAMDAFQGTVIAECTPRHRNQERIKFLGKIDRVTPGGFELHLIADKHATHRVQSCLARDSRFHIHSSQRVVPD